MKKITASLMLLAFLFAFNNTFAQRGHYSKGKGSSHKGGKYKNSSTGNHYRKRH